MADDRTPGYVSDVAAAFMRERGLDPSETFPRAREAARLDRRGQLEFERSGRREFLYFKEGVLSASLAFEGGHFLDDTLMIWGDHPASRARALKGKRFAAIAPHPVLALSGLVAERAKVQRGTLHLSVDRALLPLEEAQRVYGLGAPPAEAA